MIKKTVALGMRLLKTGIALNNNRVYSNNQIKNFFAIVSAGLWEHDICLSPLGVNELHQLRGMASEQSVDGLFVAGIEHLKDVRIPKAESLAVVGSALQMEHRNLAMNNFIGVIVEKMRQSGIDAILVKGQGIAQCYERPQWRSCGDVDLLLDAKDYTSAKDFFAKLASSVEEEEFVSKHIGYTIDPWIVELHGHMYFGLSQKANKVIVKVERDILHLGGIRVWENNKTNVFLPSPNNDCIIIFTHFLGHFCFGGVGLRQLCDLCRLLWTYREQINVSLLKSRLKEMGLMSEWRVFAYLAVDWLDMPAEAMPFYSAEKKYKRRADRAVNRILQTGNFGHNNDESYRCKKSKLASALLTMSHRLSEYFYLMTVFPLDAHLFFYNYLLDKKRISKAKKNKSYKEY